MPPCYDTIMGNQFTHPWTKQELEFLKACVGKRTYKQMSHLINRTPASIQSKIRYLPFQQKINKHSVNSNFFKIWSPDMAYVTGFIAADGNICHSGRGYVLHIACDDKDIIEKIKLVLSYRGPIHQKLRINGKISYSLRICDPTIFHDLDKLGITERKSLTLKPPTIPRKLVRHFIRGYFDGDGSVSLRTNPIYKSPLNASFYTASIHMAEFLQSHLLPILGYSYRGHVNKYTSGHLNSYYVLHLGHKACTILFAYLYKDTTLFLERKYNKFIKGMSYVN